MAPRLAPLRADDTAVACGAGALPVEPPAVCLASGDALPVLPPYYRGGMAVRKKRSISMPPELDVEIAAAAAEAGLSYSAWLAATARKEFTIRAGLAAIGQFEQDHGAFTAEEIADADAWAARAIERSGQTRASARRRSV